MANDKNISNFTAADIEKYHQGLLSNKERHALEKASLDDPFLADALEGYATGGVQAGNDMEELKKRLEQKIQGAKVIQLPAARKNNFRILRAAVLLAFVAGASLLIYQFGFNKETTEIAEAKPAKKENTVTTDTDAKSNTKPDATFTTPATGTSTTATPTGPSNNTPVVTVTDKEINPDGNAKIVTGETPVRSKSTTFDDVTISKPGGTKPVVTTPAKTAEENNYYFKTETKAAEKKELARKESNERAKKDQELDKVVVVRDEVSVQQNNRAVAANTRQAEEQRYRNQQNQSSIFRGRVTDADNNGVPFANVTNVQDNNAGTYTDARGYFNLIYPDSVLTVQVKSIGFENNNVQLRNSVSNNQVVLQDDRKTLSEVVLSKQKPNAIARSRDGNMKLEEPEPADGWDNYDTYLTNNLEVPKDLKNKQNGSSEVQVSFEVNKNGEPVNIRLEKSLCAQCDKEAIRLVKEGPKWKRKAKKGRTTVTISF